MSNLFISEDTEIIDINYIEQEVMIYLTANSKKMCTMFDIFRDIVSDNNIRNPEILNNLKIILNVVLRTLDSKFINITVNQKNGSYCAGYNVPSITVDSSDNIIDLSDTADNIIKSTFEYIVDNNIQYADNADFNGNSLLFNAVYFNDDIRTKKLISQFNVSFFEKNNNDLTPLDYQTPSILNLKYAIQENHKIINELKSQNYRLAEKNIILEAKIIDIDKINNIFKTSIFNINKELLEMNILVNNMNANITQSYNFVYLSSIILIIVIAWYISILKFSFF